MSHSPGPGASSVTWHRSSSPSTPSPASSSPVLISFSTSHPLPLPHPHPLTLSHLTTAMSSSNPWTTPSLPTRNRIRRQSTSSTSDASGGVSTVRGLSPPPLGRGGGEYEVGGGDAGWGEDDDAHHGDGNGENRVIHSRDIGSGNGIIPDISYGERLKDILDEDDEDEDKEVEMEVQVHEGLNDELDPNEERDDDDDEDEDDFGQFHGFRDDNSDKSPSTISITSTKFPNLNANAHEAAPSPSRRSPFLPPNVSRLRSHTRFPSTSSIGTNQSSGLNPFLTPSSAGARPRPLSVHSHFSAISRSSSYNALAGHHLKTDDRREDGGSSIMMSDPGVMVEGPSFIFHPLGKAMALLSGREGKTWGAPTVMAVNGMMAFGTEGGYAVVLGFGQELKCVCGSEAIAKDAGAVTAIAISPDQTYIAVGHSTGSIYLYDLLSPQRPVRSAPSLPHSAVRSGRKEGHIVGSRILHVGFVGKRHTAVVSGDEYGRAFWWSLGKVMGVESNDVVRLLGSYDPPTNDGGGPTPTKRKKPTLLAAIPLPFGPQQHPTDTFTLTALMTPSKLLIVGLKPSPRTWFRKIRPSDESHMAGGKGAAVWLPAGERVVNEVTNSPVRDPMLAYSWGRTLRLLSVKVMETVLPSAGSSARAPNRVEFVDGKSWQAEEAISGLRWYGQDGRHLLVACRSRIELLSVATMTVVESTRMDSALLPSTGGRVNGHVERSRGGGEQQVVVYKGKVFLFQSRLMMVGSLLLWSDRLLALCQAGDFLGAIRLAVAYYTDEAPGTRIGLPDDSAQRQRTIANRIVELVQSSVKYSFSEDRAMDGTYDSPDGRGVDLTSTFEDLAATSIAACMAIGRMDLIYEELYERFLEAGIQGIFLDQLQDSLLAGQLPDIPPGIVQALIARHEDQGNFKLAEMIIWHVSSMSLDINQAIRLCEKHGLWDALIYVYNGCLSDYISPLNRLMDLIADILQSRADRPQTVNDDFDGDISDVETSAPGAYKVYSYLEHILTGHTYPDSKEMPTETKATACGDIYAALFSGHYEVTKDTSNGDFVTPYRQLHALLSFDAESFLHVLDLAFEDPYLNGSTDGRLISRQVVVNILLELAQTGRLATADRSFIHIFVARNLPKYPQFLFIPPSTLHNILVDLTRDNDLSTREDRELAVEYLLSAYTPHDMEGLYDLFHKAGFYRLLRSAYRSERRWSPLISSYVDDPEVDLEVLPAVRDILREASVAGVIPRDVVGTVRVAVPAFLDIDIQQTAVLLQDTVPEIHETALHVLAGSPHKQMAYLRSLLQPSEEAVHSLGGPNAVAKDLRQRYFELLITQAPDDVIPYLDMRGPAFFDLPQIQQLCSTQACPEGRMWSLDKQNRVREAFEVVTENLEQQSLALMRDGSDPESALQVMESVVRLAIRICREREATETDSTDLSLEEMWYQLLRDCLATLHVLDSKKAAEEASPIASNTLRLLMQETLSSLMTATTARSRAFPQLFKRLVDSTLDESSVSSSRAYAQFRTILTGMLESYAGERDTLELTTRLISADLFECIKELHLKRQAGWRPEVSSCATCRKEIMVDVTLARKAPTSNEEPVQVMLYASGEVGHVGCLYAAAAGA